jgi:2-keto-4-pentenoate hydratase
MSIGIELTLASQGAEPLAAGEVVTTGTLTPALPIKPGERWQSVLDGHDRQGRHVRCAA